MKRFKKILLVFALLVIAVVIYFSQTNFAQEASEDDLEFCVDSGKIYFFQPQTGRIYVYQATTNRFSRVLTLEKLGEDLKQSRSLSVLEEDEY